jgi:CheY-like chemotaxis protein
MLRQAEDIGSPFHLVIFDLGIHDMSCDTFWKEVKTHRKATLPQLAIISSLNQDPHLSCRDEPGCRVCLKKPIKGGQLLECLAQVFGTPSGTSDNPTSQITTQMPMTKKETFNAPILLVEDNAVNQKLAVRLLEKAGYKADVVANGREAIETLEKVTYDLVLMDVQMPEMNGYEATKVIRDGNSNVRDHNVPIVAMTANAMEGDRERCLEAGMSDYIAKPIKQEALLEAIQTYLPAQNNR